MRFSGRTLTAVFLVALVAGAGCGGDDDDAGSGGGGSEAVDERVDAPAFAAAFRKDTGVKLESDKSTTWVLLDAGADPDVYGEYGSFTIYVLQSVDAGLDTLTSDDKGNAVEPDADGIYWDPPKAGESGIWSATKVFGNVVVRSSVGDEKQTDDRWDRLTAAVEKAVDTAGS